LRTFNLSNLSKSEKDILTVTLHQMKNVIVGKEFMMKPLVSKMKKHFVTKKDEINAFIIESQRSDYMAMVNVGGFEYGYEIPKIDRPKKVRVVKVK